MKHSQSLRYSVVGAACLAICMAGCKRDDKEAQRRYENAKYHVELSIREPRTFGLGRQDKFITDVYLPAFRNARDRLPAIARGDIHTYALMGFIRNLNRGNYLICSEWMQHDTGPRKVVLRDAQGPVGEFSAQAEPSPQDTYVVADVAILATQAPYDGGPGITNGESVLRVNRTLDRPTLQLAIVEPNAVPTSDAWIPVAVSDLPPDLLPAIYKVDELAAPSTQTAVPGSHGRGTPDNNVK